MTDRSSVFVALVHKDLGSDYGVSFPDLPGCISAGRNLAEALAMAEEALTGHLELMIDEGLSVPAPSDVATVARSRGARGAVLVLVKAAPRRRRAMRIDITMNERLLRKIDRVAGERGQTRSAFLEVAALRELAAHRAG